MANRFALRSVAAALMVAFATPMAPVAVAGNHPLSAVADVNTLDYVVNVDWDFDSPPTQVSNPSQVLDRAYITSVLRTMAQAKFTMTEGRHRVGTVYVYRNGLFGNNVDIRLLNTDGRSSASISGWTVRNLTSFNHLAMDKNPETIDQVGKVVTHELGHYTYGLFDEYREDGKALNPADPGGPSGIDTPKDTIMNNHLNFVSLSTPADYTDATARKTAQARVMGTNGVGGSAWEMLARTPDKDPVAAQSQGRTFFEAFRGMDPATLTLTKPVTGFDAKLNVVFVANPVFRDVILVDRTLPQERFDALVQAAKSMVAQAKDNTRYAILAYPAAAADGLVLGYTANSIEGKQALNAALDGLKPEPTGSFDSSAAFTRARALIDTERQPGDPATIHLLTGNEAVVLQQTVTEVRAARVAVNPLALTGGTTEQAQRRRNFESRNAVGGTTLKLSELASLTGGSYNTAKNGSDAAKDALKAVNETHADPYAPIVFDLSDPLKAGAVFNSSFRVASGASDGEVSISLYFDPADAAKLAFALVSPAGTVYAPGQLPAGIGYDIDATEGVAEFTLATDLAGRVGQWTVRATASATTTDGVGVDVAGLTRVALNAQVLGGAAGALSDPVLTAVLGGDKRIKGATVTAAVFDTNGNLVLDNLTLRDDGVAPDARAGDGQYSLSLGGKLKAGDYFVVVHSQTNADSRTASLGTLVKGTRAEEQTVEVFERVAEADFVLEATAAGVVPATPPAPTTPTTPAPTDSGSGGCTVNPGGKDAGLLLLLAAALAGGLLRRRTARTRSRG